MLKEFIEKHEENIITVITVICIIITLIVVVITWVFNMGEKNKEKNLNTYEEINYKTEMLSEYSDIITNLLKTTKIEELYDKLDFKFLSENSLNRENIRDYLLNNGLIGNSIGIISSDCIQNGDIYIFRYYYKNYNDNKYVNIIESKPYEYVISFEQDITELENYENNYTSSNNNIDCYLSLIDTGNEFIKFNIKITNNNNLDAEIDMNDINTFCLFGKDLEIPVSSVATTSINKLTKNSSVSKELYFNLSQEDKDECEGVKINNINVNGEYFDIEIYF